MTTLDDAATYRLAHRFNASSGPVGVWVSRQPICCCAYFRIRREKVSIDRGLYDDGSLLRRVWARDYDYISRCTRAYISRWIHIGCVERERKLQIQGLSRGRVAEGCLRERVLNRGWIKRIHVNIHLPLLRLRLGGEGLSLSKGHYCMSSQTRRVLSALKVLYILYQIPR
jgi:hypothetical protein